MAAHKGLDDMDLSDSKDSKDSKKVTPDAATGAAGAVADSAVGSATGSADPKKDDKKKKDAGAIKGLADDDANSSKKLKLSSKDKKEFTVERKHGFVSSLVKTALENDDKAEEVPIPGVTGAILELVVNYMKEHKGVEPQISQKPLRSKVMKDVCPHKWDADFIDKIGETRQQLYDLILAANYMDIKSLLHLGCAKVASLIKGQPLEKIKEILDPNQGAVAGAAAGAAAAGASGSGAAAGAAKMSDDAKDSQNIQKVKRAHQNIRSRHSF